MPALRRSYRALASLPAWLLVADDGEIVASVRASDEAEALHIFRAHRVYILDSDTIHRADLASGWRA
jgi:rhodanese-related sulfurtransferase